jgi:hypothetical protein
MPQHNCVPAPATTVDNDCLAYMCFLLQPKSYNSTEYMPGKSSDTLAVQVPTLGDVMPAYTMAAHVLLPMSTAAAGLVCLLSVLVAPGGAGCSKTVGTKNTRCGTIAQHAYW